MTIAIGPSVASINRVTGENTNASTLNYTVTFSSSITGIDTGDFTLARTETANGGIVGVSGSGSVYTVTVNGVTGDGTLRLDLNSSGTGIIDGSGNAILSGYTAGQSYNLDHTGPLVSSVAVPANGIYGAGQALDFTVNFNETITVDTTAGTPRLAVTLGTGTVYADYVGGSGGTALTFRYTVVAGNADADGIAVGSSLDLNGGTLKDDVGNNVTLTLNSVGSTTGVLVSALAAAPVFNSASVTGNSLLLSYTEATTLDEVNKPATGAFEVKVGGVVATVTAVTINAAAKTVTLTLATGAVAGQAVTVAYTDPTVGDDANALQNAAGTDAVSLAATAVTNNTPAVAPVFSSAAVTGNSLVVSYTEATTLDAFNKPATSAYEVKVNGMVYTVTAVTIDATAKTATLTLNTAVAAGQTVTVAYTDPTAGDDLNALQNILGNDAASFTAIAVSNTTAPVSSGGLSGVIISTPATGGTLNGTIYSDVLTGLGGKDTFHPNGGSDQIDGGDGIDTVVLNGARDQYSLTHNSNGTFTLQNLLDSSANVALKSVERLQFNDSLLAIDVTLGSAQLAQLYHLALGRNPDDGGWQYHIGVSAGGASTSQIVSSFVASVEFAAGNGALSDAAFLTQLYGNAFNRAPDSGGFAYWQAQLANVPGDEGRAQVIEGFLASDEMAIQITGQIDQSVELLMHS